MITAIDLTLLILMLLAALWTVMTHVLLRSAIGLAVTSAILTILMFRLNAPLAAVFELSVCTGLISVVFISTISLTQRLPYPDYIARRKNRNKRFILLPILLAVVGVVLLVVHKDTGLTLPPATIPTWSNKELWTNRQLDLVGQILILLTGVYGVVILFKEMRKK